MPTMNTPAGPSRKGTVSRRPVRPLLALVATALALLLATSVVAAAEAASTTSAGVVTYPGGGVRVWRLGGDVKHLDGTPAGFKKFVRHRLDRLWAVTGKDVACRHSALVSVKRYHPRRYAEITDEGVFPHAGDPARCAQGGTAAIYARWNGRWRVILTAQEPYQCADLRRYRVPAVIGGPKCFDRRGHLVEYRP